MGVINIKIIEKFIAGKTSDELCEDSYFSSEDFVVVIDGVTSKSDFTYDGKTTGKLASDIIRGVLEKMNREDSIDVFLNKVNEQFNDFYKEVEFPYSIKEKGLQAVCAVYSDYYREIWLIGDCQVSVDGKVYLNPKKSDEILADMRSLVLHILKKENVDWPEAQKRARDIIETWILKANVFANKAEPPFGYAVINGNEIPDSLIKIIKLDSNPHEIIFTSDGYPKVKSDLKKSEEYLNTILEQDKSCYELYLSTKGINKGQKSFDDRTYIRFSV
ncbi:MAG: hypothetical protein Q4B86_08360 [Eubacteriales bacterium]|nr:hypothetical protein [Eubacteriales bacterium]